MSDTKPTSTVLELYVNRGGRHNWRLFDARNGEKLARGSQAQGFTTARGAWINAKGVVLRLSGYPLPRGLPAIGSETMDTWNMRHEDEVGDTTGTLHYYELIIRRPKPTF